jgi:hypothetical protein
MYEWMDNHRTMCNAYCADGVHATLVMARADTQHEHFEQYCAARGYVFVDVRRAVEVEPAAVRAVMANAWNVATGVLRPLEPSDWWEDYHVWLLRLRFLPPPRPAGRPAARWRKWVTRFEGWRGVPRTEEG